MNLKLHLPKIHRPPSVVVLVQGGVLAVVVATSGAIGYGLGATTTPQSCVAALNTADRISIGQTNLVSAVNARGDALDRETFAEHDADVNLLLDELDRMTPRYDAAADECLDGAK